MTVKDKRPHVVLGLFDRDGQVDVEAIQYPDAYDPESPAHVIGRWLQLNIEQVVEAASRSAAAMVEPQVLSAPTIIVP